MKKVIRILGIVAAIVGIVFGVQLVQKSNSLTLPEKYVYVSSSSSAYNYSWERNTGAEYLGGDAYNYIVEASLKAGYYSGVRTEKTVTYVGGLGLIFASVFFLLYSFSSLLKCSSEDKKLDYLKEIAEKCAAWNEKTPVVALSGAVQKESEQEEAPLPELPEL